MDTPRNIWIVISAAFGPVFDTVEFTRGVRWSSMGLDGAPRALPKTLRENCHGAMSTLWNYSGTTAVLLHEKS